MAVVWLARFIFTDEKGNKTSRTHATETAGADMAVEFTGVLTDIDALIADYRAISDANVAMELRMQDSDYFADTAEADSDVSDVAHVNAYIVGPPDEKLYSFAIPAPLDALFVGGAAGTEVDITNTALQDFVANFAADWEVSDGDNIDTEVGAAGIKDGEWRSRKLNPR